MKESREEAREALREPYCFLMGGRVLLFCFGFWREGGVSARREGDQGQVYLVDMVCALVVFV